MIAALSPETRRRYLDAVAWVESFIRPITGQAPPRTRESWLQEGPDRLARMQALLAAVGHPERTFSSLHVTGTSGKGSVCTYVGAILGEAGIRTGVHATPYLQTPVEKLQVGGRYAPAAQLIDVVEEFRRLLPGGRPEAGDLPYPALWVALTYLYFARMAVETAVVEVSTGGRFDWTNTLDSSVAVITTVGPDHLNALGPTLDDVAFHKSGIIKPGRPSVTGVHAPQLAIVEQEAAAQGSGLRRLGLEFDFEVRACTDAGTTFDYRAPGRERLGLVTSMLGRYQAFNAALAVAAIDALGEQRGALPEDAVREGLLRARLPGRMELIQRSPDVILDGAHNPEKAAALAESLQEIFPGRRLLLVVGALSTKDVGGIITPFAAQTRRAFVTVPHVLGKAGQDPELLAVAVGGLGIPAEAVADPEAAVRAAMSVATPDDLVCVTGSLYLAGEVRRLWVADDAVLTSGDSYSPGAATVI